MSTREELLAGVKRINKEVLPNEGQDSEDTTAYVGGSLEGGPDQRKPSLPGVPGTRVQATEGYLQGDEESLESIMRAQVISRSAALREVESEIARCRDKCRTLDTLANKLTHDIEVACEVLANEYDDCGGPNAKDPVPKEGPGLETETGED